MLPDSQAKHEPGGQWQGSVLHSYLDDAVREHPDRVALVAYRSFTGERMHLTYQELSARASAFAASLASCGIGRGDVVAVQLPNWWEFPVAIMGILRLGAIYTGVPHGFRQRELRYVLTKSEAKAIVVPSGFRQHDHVEMMRHLAPEIPSLETVIIAGASNHRPQHWRNFREMTERNVQLVDIAADVNALVNIGFSSGTTGEPKGIMNTHNTFGAVLRAFCEFEGDAFNTEDSVHLVASPIAHNTAFLWGVIASLYMRGTMVLMDHWSPESAVDVIADERVTTTVWAPTFLLDLVSASNLHTRDLTSLRFVCIAGSPISRPLVRRATAELGCFVVPAWGMTEYGIGIAASPQQPAERVTATDGMPVRPCEVRVVDEEGHESPRGVVGELQIRGPGLFVGYYRRSDLTSASMTPDGWFQTGDLAVLELDGFVRLTGRSKDLVIRGGENIPVVEIESLLSSHPNVRESAVVGMPDQRLGERACAFVVLTHPDARLTLDDITEFLLGEGMTKRYLPEALRIVDTLPKTPSGKIQKFLLRKEVGVTEQPTLR